MNDQEWDEIEAQRRADREQQVERAQPVVGRFAAEWVAEGGMMSDLEDHAEYQRLVDALESVASMDARGLV